MGAAALGSPAGQDPATADNEINLPRLQLPDKTGFRWETGRAGMCMPGRQVTTIRSSLPRGEEGVNGRQLPCRSCPFKPSLRAVRIL